MKPNNKEIQNDYRSIRPSVQKSLSCNKLTASNPQVFLKFKEKSLILNKENILTQKAAYKRRKSI